MKNHIAFGVITLLAANTAQAQDKHEFSSQFLTNKQGELCTMCEADVVCAPRPAEPAVTAVSVDNAGPVASLSTGTVTLHFHKRGFVGQMSTVLDYFPLTRKFALSHSRDVDVVQDGAAPTTASANFNLETKRIDISSRKGEPMFWIDRTTGSWRGADGAERGMCSLKK